MRLTTIALVGPMRVRADYNSLGRAEMERVSMTFSRGLALSAIIYLASGMLVAERAKASSLGSVSWYGDVAACAVLEENEQPMCLSTSPSPSNNPASVSFAHPPLAWYLRIKQ